MPQVLKAWIERRLSAGGFTEAPLRAVALGQVLFLAASFLAGTVLLYRTSQGMFFFLGAALFSLNFWSMSGSLLRLTRTGYSAELFRGHFFRFLFRLLLFGLALALALRVGASPPALALGMFSSLAVIGLTGLAALSR